MNVMVVTRVTSSVNRTYVYSIVESCYLRGERTDIWESGLPLTAGIRWRTMWKDLV